MKGIRHKVETACQSMKCTAHQIFLRAFKHKFGKSRGGIVREANSAYTRWKKKGTLTSRARLALTAFLANMLNSTPAPAAV